MKYNILRWVVSILLLLQISIADAVPKRIPRMNGGTDVERIGNDWSFVIAVYYDNVYMCIFSLITTQSSVGPASCLYNRNISFFYGKAGHVTRERGSIIKFSNYIIHHDYVPFTDDDDIALLMVGTSLLTGSLDFLKPAIIPVQNALMEFWKAITVAGWGISTSGPSFMEGPYIRYSTEMVLQSKIFPLNQTAAYTSSHSSTYKTFCIDFKGDLFILGEEDLGAPAVWKFGEIQRLYGFKSNKLSSTSIHDIFTSVQYYYRWIKDNSIGSFELY